MLDGTDRLCRVALYGQDAEVRLLGRLIGKLGHRSCLDVGAERGGLAEEMLRVGIEELHAFDPHPDNAKALHGRFDTDPRVTVHECAVSDGNGRAELHVSSSPDGTPLSYGHTLLERADTGEITWSDTVIVTRRSLESLVESSTIPSRVGILKIDTEGHDLAVVRGMGTLEADIVMVEHWTELPAGLGVCPWRTEEMVQAMQARGFAHFAFIVHRGEFVTLKWDDGEIERGAMGNLVFLHERVLDALLPDLMDCAGSLAETAVRIGQGYMQAAAERLALVGELDQAAKERLLRVKELDEVAEERLQTLAALTAELEARDAELQALKLRDPTS
jgi:FkbM family methyltransferase